MRFVIREYFRSLITHLGYNCLIVFELTCSVLVVFILLSNLSISSTAANEYKESVSDKILFNLYVIDPSYFDAVSGGEYPSEEVIAAINDDPAFSLYDYGYLSMSLPYVNGEAQLPETFCEGYEDGYSDEYYEMAQDPDNSLYQMQRIKCMMVDKYLMEEYDMTVSCGRLFTDEEYEVWDTRAPQPVILGYDYLEYYSVGDIIELQYDSLLVIGFLEEDTLLPDQIIVGTSSLMSLDRYVIYPTAQQALSEDGSLVTTYTEGSYFFSGTLVVHDPTVNIQDKLNRITNLYGFPPLSATQWAGSALESAEIISQRNVCLYFVLAAVLYILSLFSVSSILVRRMEKEKITYGIYMVSGVSPGHILFAIVLELITFGVLSVLLPIWISYAKYGCMTIPVWNLFVITVPVLAVSFLSTMRIFMKIDLDKVIRRKSQ